MKLIENGIKKNNKRKRIIMTGEKGMFNIKYCTS